MSFSLLEFSSPMPTVCCAQEWDIYKIPSVANNSALSVTLLDKHLPVLINQGACQLMWK